MDNKPKIIASSNNVPSNMGKAFGESGTAIMNGIITGEEYNTRLQGKQAIRMYDIMRRSEESVRAALQMVKLPLLNQTNDIKPVDESTKADFRKRFLKRELFERNVDFDKLKREGLTFADFGHSVCEVTYELTMFEGTPLIGIKEIGFRKQTSIDAWQTKDKKPGITQMLVAPQEGSAIRSIIRPKLIIWTHDQEGDNYEGISLLRYAFKSWDMADKLGLVHAIGLEKMAIPTPVLGVPKGANASDEASAIESIQQYRSNERSFIKKPAGWELDAFDLSSQSIDQLLPALQHYETKILLSVLGQFLMLGASAGGSGSRAVSEDHSKLFMLSEESFSKTFNGAIQRDLINMLEYLNFSGVEETGYSQLISSAVKDDDVQILSEAVSKLKQSSMITPTFETENHLRNVMKLPVLSEDYAKDYEKRRELALSEPFNSNPTNNGKPETNTNNDKSLENDKNTKASLISDAKNVQKRLIQDILRV